MPDAHAQRRLVLCVPRRSHQRNGGHKRTLSDAHDEPAEDEPPAPCDGGHTDCRDGPGKHAAGHEKARATLGNDDVGGDLRDDVSDVEHGDAGRPHRVRHV